MDTMEKITDLLDTYLNLRDEYNNSQTCNAGTFQRQEDRQSLARSALLFEIERSLKNEPVLVAKPYQFLMNKAQLDWVVQNIDDNPEGCKTILYGLRILE